MKITVSYINSLYDTNKTIDLINKTSADGIHVDLMDGYYAGKSNFDINNLQEVLKNVKKPMDIHMMVNNPSKYLDKLLLFYPDCIYIHPKTEVDTLNFLNNLKKHNIKRGIAINPDELLTDFTFYFPYIDRVLLMSVNPGFGGQKFIDNTKDKIDKLLSLKENNNFEVYIDGGINIDIISKVSQADGVVVGSYICRSNDFEKQINELKNVA